MPVVTLYFNRLRDMLKRNVAVSQLIERLPYIGLDLEEVSEDYVRVEYNPNRPDYSTDYGVGRALNAHLGFEAGAPVYTVSQGSTVVLVDPSVKEVRPFVVAMVAKDIALDDESVRQFIAMQEDLHIGIGRNRRKVSIGLHNLDVIKPPIKYSTVTDDFEFIPLNCASPMSVKEILGSTDTGMSYGWILASHERYPMLTDSAGEVLSFPPIINGELTRVSSATRNLFIDITGTDLEVVSNSLAILAAGLHDAGADLETVRVQYADRELLTPDLTPRVFEVRTTLVNRLLGLDLSDKEVVECLARSRISASNRSGIISAVVPKYRVDILHPVDIVEEVALGYGIDRFVPTIPISAALGRLGENAQNLSTLRNVLTGFGVMEVMNFSLVSRGLLYEAVGRKPSKPMAVENAKTSEHEVLRDMIIPSLLLNLSKNIHETYPQRIFEIGKIFTYRPRSPSRVVESYNCAAATAHTEANFTEARSILDGVLAQTFELDCETKPFRHPIFSTGRCAEIVTAEGRVGIIGEVRPIVLERLQLRTPVAAFELYLSRLVQANNTT